MMKIVSALLLAAMFIGCSESAKTEEAAAPVVEEANMTAEAAAPAVEANATEANATAEAAAPAAK